MTWLEPDDLVKNLQIDAEDWSAWLVYADWLAEQGDGRAELIRLEHERATAAQDPRRRDRIDARIASLVAADEGTWLSGIDIPPTASFGWSRGFVVGVSMPWGEDGAALFDAVAVHPLGRFLHRLTLQSDDLQEEISDDVVVALTALEALSKVTTLELSFHGLGEEGLRALVAAPTLRNLASLALVSVPIGDEGAAILAASDRIRALRRLDLNSTRLGPDGLRALLGGGPAAWIDLGLSGNDLGAEGAEVLAQAALPRLERLDLAMTALGNPGAAALAEGTSLRGVASLELWGNDIGPSGVRALAEAGFFRGTRKLNLGQNTIGDGGILALVASGSLAGCESLELNDAKIGDRGAQTLAEADLGSMTHLGLGDNHICDLGAAALSAAPLGSLELLRLSNNLIGPPGALALAGSGTLRASLEMEGNDLDDEAIVALSRSGRLSEMTVHVLLFRFGDRGYVLVPRLGEEARAALVRCLDDDRYRSMLEELPEADGAMLAAARGREGAAAEPHPPRIEPFRPNPA